MSERKIQLCLIICKRNVSGTSEVTFVCRDWMTGRLRVPYDNDVLFIYLERETYVIQVIIWCSPSLYPYMC